MVARLLWEQDVGGSNPSSPTTFFGHIATVEVLGRTQSVVAVAHQVEHRIVAPEVVGSRPIQPPHFIPSNIVAPVRLVALEYPVFLMPVGY